MERTIELPQIEWSAWAASASGLALRLVFMQLLAAGLLTHSMMDQKETKSPPSMVPIFTSFFF